MSVAVMTGRRDVGAFDEISPIDELSARCYARAVASYCCYFTLRRHAIAIITAALRCHTPRGRLRVVVGACCAKAARLCCVSAIDAIGAPRYADAALLRLSC